MSQRACANCGVSITFWDTGSVRPGNALEEPQKQFAALNPDGTPHRCGMSTLRRRTFAELTPEERERFGIKASV